MTKFTVSGGYHPVDFGHVAPGMGSWERCLPGDFGHVNPGPSSGRGSC